jgi:uncharacterized protein (TIGR03083 family)
MSFTLVDKPATIDALASVWASTRELLAGLDDSDWKAPTPLPGWDVAANVAHMIGTEAMLLGIDAPAAEVDRRALPHVRNDIGAFNEAWVIEMADTPPAGLLERFTTITAQRIGALQAMDEDGWNAESWTPVGRESYGRFMRIRVFDCWMHEQDIRDGVGRPGDESGPAVDAVLDEIAVSLGYVVAKLADAPDGATVTYRLTGEAARELHVAVDGRAALVDSLPGDATVTLTMPVGAFTRLCGGRCTPDEARARIDVTGDDELARRLIANGAYTI